MKKLPVVVAGTMLVLAACGGGGSRGESAHPASALPSDARLATTTTQPAGPSSATATEGVAATLSDVDRLLGQAQQSNDAADPDRTRAEEGNAP